MSERSSSPSASVQRLSNKQSTVLLRKFIIDQQDKISDEWIVQVDECFYGLSQSYVGN